MIGTSTSRSGSADRFTVTVTLSPSVTEYVAAAKLARTSGIARSLARTSIWYRFPPRSSQPGCEPTSKSVLGVPGIHMVVLPRLESNLSLSR